MEFNNKKYYVRVSEDALLQLCLYGLEAYEISHNGGQRKKTMLETYGNVLGHSRLLPSGETLISVDMVSVDTSAKQNESSCLPNEKALELKYDVLNAYWPQYEYIGDFHTHPYKNVDEVNYYKGWRQSEQDFISVEADPYQDGWLKYNYRLGIVLAICKMQRKGSLNPTRIQSNTLRFDIGNYRCWITAYVACTNYKEKDGKLRFIPEADVDKYILIDSSAIHGIDGEFMRFRRK